MDQQKLKEVFICPICLDVFKDPRVDRCGHTFCKDCIENQIMTNNKCPLSNELITNSDISENFIVKNFLETWNVKIKCEKCNTQYYKKEEQIHLIICELKKNGKLNKSIDFITELLKKNNNLIKKNKILENRNLESIHNLKESKIKMATLKNDLDFYKSKIKNLEIKNKILKKSFLDMEINFKTGKEFMDKIKEKGFHILKYNQNIFDECGDACYELTINYKQNRVFFFFFIEYEKVTNFIYFRPVLSDFDNKDIKNINSIEWMYSGNKKPNFICDENIVNIEISKENEGDDDIPEEEYNQEGVGETGFKISIATNNGKYNKQFFIIASDCHFFKMVCPSQFTTDFARFIKIK